MPQPPSECQGGVAGAHEVSGQSRERRPGPTSGVWGTPATRIKLTREPGCFNPDVGGEWQSARGPQRHLWEFQGWPNHSLPAGLEFSARSRGLRAGRFCRLLQSLRALEVSLTVDDNHRMLAACEGVNATLRIHGHRRGCARGHLSGEVLPEDGRRVSRLHPLRAVVPRHPAGEPGPPPTEAVADPAALRQRRLGGHPRRAAQGPAAETAVLSSSASLEIPGSCPRWAEASQINLAAMPFSSLKPCSARKCVCLGMARGREGLGI